MVTIMKIINRKLHDRSKVLINIIIIILSYYSNNCAGDTVIVRSFCKKSSSVRK